MIASLKRFVKIIVKNVGTILMFEFVYRILSLLILWETLNRGIGIALRFSGYSYLTIGNIFSFITKPFTIVIVVLMLFICFILQLFEISVLFTGFKVSADENKIRLSELVYLGLKNLKNACGLHNLISFVPAMVFGICVNMCFMWRMLKHIRPIQYYISHLKNPVWIKYAGISFFLIMVILLAVTVYQLAFLTIERCSMRISREKGVHFFKERPVRITAAFMAVNAAAFGLYSLLNKLLLNIFVAIITLFAKEKYHMALMFTAGDYTDIISSVIASSLCAVFISAICISIFISVRRQPYTWEGKINLYWIPDRFRKTVKIVSVIVLLIFSGLYIYNAVYNGTIKAEGSLFNIQITSHRGSSLQAPENTMPAIEKAIENMTDYIEIDVQMTKDGEVMLMHDQSLKRTTGVNAKMQDMTYDEVIMLDAGSWFDEEFAGTSVPSLEEVIKTVKGHANLNIELKKNAMGDMLPEKVVELIERYDMEKQCVITSTSHEYLKKVKELNGNLRTGYIVMAAYGNYFEDDSVDFFSVCSSYLSESTVKQARQCGKEIHAWTVNSIKELDRMKRIQVDNVITDNPVLARSVLYQ